MHASIVLTVVSKDRPGIVDSLSEVLNRHGGNWAESSMLSLAGQFAGILLASLPADQVTAFTQALEVFEAEGVQVVVRKASLEATVASTREFSLDLVGQDHPGIVHDVTHILAKHSLNVKELETTCESASMSGESLFMAHARLVVPEDANVQALREELEELANELMVDINFEG